MSQEGPRRDIQSLSGHRAASNAHRRHRTHGLGELNAQGSTAWGRSEQRLYGTSSALPLTNGKMVPAALLF
jgi:hypothetical protein